jgi:hypothetical protein
LIGKRHAPPVVDGRMTKEKSLKKAMELLFIKTTITFDIGITFRCIFLYLDIVRINASFDVIVCFM